jgi:hypothetical protein
LLSILPTPAETHFLLSGKNFFGKKFQRLVGFCFSRIQIGTCRPQRPKCVLELDRFYENMRLTPIPSAQLRFYGENSKSFFDYQETRIKWALLESAKIRVPEIQAASFAVTQVLHRNRLVLSRDRTESFQQTRTTFAAQSGDAQAIPGAVSKRCRASPARDCSRATGRGQRGCAT